MYLRVYRFGWRKLEEIDCELDILAHLARQSIPVCSPLKSEDGRSIMQLECAEGTRYAVLFDTAAGSIVEYDDYKDDLAFAYGVGAGSLARGMIGYDGQMDRKPLDVDTLIFYPLEQIRRVFGNRLEDQAYLARIGENIAKQIQSKSGLTLGFCHGDLHGQNANLQSGAFTFFDFDCCGWGYSAYDPATFAWVFLMRRARPSIVARLLGEFLRGYETQISLTPGDLSSIGYFIGARQLWFMGLQTELAKRTGELALAGRFFEREMALLKHCEAHVFGRSPEDWTK